MLSLLSLIIGIAIGYLYREIKELDKKLHKSPAAVIRGREVISKEHSERRAGVVIKPKSPKQVAIESANKFNNDFER